MKQSRKALALALTVLSLAVIQPTHAGLKNFITGADLKVGVLVPPKTLLPKVRTIALLDFEGNRGTQLSGALLDFLTQGDRTEAEQILQKGGTTKIFEFIERSRIESVVTEQNFGRSGRIDERSAVKLGKILGVDAIMVGSLQISSENVKSGDKYTPVVSGSAEMRLIATQTGQILAATKRDLRADGDEGGYFLGLSYKGTTTEELVNAAIKQAAWNLANEISPYYATLELNLKKGDGDTKKLTSEGRKLALGGAWNEAMQRWLQAQKADPYSAQNNYNLAVTYEIHGNCPKALELYKAAVAVTVESAYSEGISRCEAFQGANEALAMMGVVLEPWDPSAEGAVAMASSGNSCKVQGSSGKRKEIREGADVASPVVVKVPGGMTVTRVENKGSWIHVQTFDGKDGWIAVADVQCS